MKAALDSSDKIKTFIYGILTGSVSSFAEYLLFLHGA